MKRPHILYSEQNYTAGQRAPFAIATDFLAPRDMDVQYIWFGAAETDEAGLPVLTGNEHQWELNWNVKTQPPIVRRNPVNLRLFGNVGQDKQDDQWQRGWNWNLKHRYRIQKDRGIIVSAQNVEPPSIAVTTDAFAFAAQCSQILPGVDKAGQQVMLTLEDRAVPRSMTAPRSLNTLPGTHLCDGRYDQDVYSVQFDRGIWDEDVPANSMIPRPRNFYIRVEPIGREPWSERLVPLSAYGFTRHPWHQAGVFWVPPQELWIPTGYGIEFDAWNRFGKDGVLQIAVVGYIEEAVGP